MVNVIAKNADAAVWDLKMPNAAAGVAAVGALHADRYALQ